MTTAIILFGIALAVVIGVIIAGCRLFEINLDADALNYDEYMENQTYWECFSGMYYPYL